MRVRLIEHEGEFWISVKEFPHSEPFIFPPEKVGISQGDILFSDFREKATQYFESKKKEKENEELRHLRID